MIHLLNRQQTQAGSLNVQVNIITIIGRNICSNAALSSPACLAGLSSQMPHSPALRQIQFLHAPRCRDFRTLVNHGEPCGACVFLALARVASHCGIWCTAQPPVYRPPSERCHMRVDAARSSATQELALQSSARRWPTRCTAHLRSALSVCGPFFRTITMRYEASPRP